ncbi:hypothetical protein EDD11_001059, partial [Mortierella claussenii]
MLMYRNISTIWRPISGRRLLIYDIPHVLTTLGISRDQLTALGAVSHNDYNRNIYGLGCATNFGIVKELNGNDAASIVQQYLADARVFLKNKTQVTFADSVNVFVRGVQIPAQSTPPPQSSVPAPATYNSVVDQFTLLREQHARNRSEEKTLQLAKK